MNDLISPIDLEMALIVAEEPMNSGPAEAIIARALTRTMGPHWPLGCDDWDEVFRMTDLGGFCCRLVQAGREMERRAQRMRRAG